jgi:hypothetical protein
MQPKINTLHTSMGQIDNFLVHILSLKNYFLQLAFVATIFTIRIVANDKL